MPFPRALSALAVAGACAALSACGGDDGGSGKQLSAADYRKQLTQICDDASAKTKAIPQATQPSGQAIKDQLSRTLPIVDDTLDKIGDLNPPDELKTAHDDYLSATKEGVGIVKDAVDDIDPKKPVTELLQQFTAIQTKTADVGKRAKAAASKLGVSSCGT